MRETQRLYARPGIALSGFGTEEDIRMSRAAGVAEHLTKPVSVESFRDTIQRVAAPCGVTAFFFAGLRRFEPPATGLRADVLRSVADISVATSLNIRLDEPASPVRAASRRISTRRFSYTPATQS